MLLRSRIIAIVALGFVLGSLSCNALLTNSGPTGQPPAPDQPPTPLPSAALIERGDLLAPAQFQYLGAFRLPGEESRPRTFEYGGSAMTFRPGGDPNGPEDGFAGSLFLTGHDRLPYGELTDGDQVAEVTIPVPVASPVLGELPLAEFLQAFHEVARGQFSGLDEIPRVAMLYLEDRLTGPKIHLAWGQHLQPDPPAASHTWFDPDLSDPAMPDPWFIGGQSPYAVNGYIFEIPEEWAERFAGGRRLAIGRYRDGGWSGMGPALLAYRPWGDDGAPPAGGSQVDVLPLLLYQNSETSDDFSQSLAGYQHPDEWEGGAWITTPGGASAVLFAGTKATGVKSWYGFVHPNGPEIPCVAGDLVGQFPVCRLADGKECPASDLTECSGHSDYRGWWSTRFDSQFLLYDPADLAAVATGELAAWQPQPYATIDIDDFLLQNPVEIESDMLGVGDQRRYRIGEVAYDRPHNRLYVLELFADGAKPVVHVWGIE
jgi:hypothetical protein